MRKRKWLALLLCGGVMLSVSSCVSDLSLYAAETASAYLPDLIDSYFESLTE